MDNLLFFPKNDDDNKVSIPSDVNKEIAEKYAPERQKNAAFYASKRGGFPPSLFDCWYYKCAEFASANFLHEKHGLPLLTPDTKIYKSSEKNWNADLLFKDVQFLNKHHDELRFHNKSVTRKSIAAGFNESFMFQFANRDTKGGRDAIFDKGDENDYCVFVYVPYTEVTNGRLDFYIRGVVPWNFIKENNLLANPKKPSLVGVKLVVYTENLRQAVQDNDFAEAIK